MKDELAQRDIVQVVENESVFFFAQLKLIHIRYLTIAATVTTRIARFIEYESI